MANIKTIPTETLATELERVEQLLLEGSSNRLLERIAILRESAFAAPLSYLIKAIEHERYADAQTLVTDLLRQHRQLASFVDPMIGALKVELNFQTNELAQIQIERDELSKKIDLFHAQYMTHVGVVLENLLFLRIEKLRIQVKQNPDLKSLLEQAEQAFEEFYSYKEDTKEGVIYHLKGKKLREIKRLYRKASLICHPDKVKEEQQEKAEEIFAKLSQAYKRNDLKKVRKIADFLEKTGGFDLKIDGYNSAEAVRAYIEQVLIQQEEAYEEIETLKASSVMYTIESIEGEWSDYFKQIRENFDNQIGEIKRWIERNEDN